MYQVKDISLLVGEREQMGSCLTAGFHSVCNELSSDGLIAIIVLLEYQS